jgi:hypothetical protein
MVTKRDFKRFKINGDKLSHWSALLKHWHLLIKNYCVFMEDDEDAPYYYTERANTGVLAGAAWRAGWIALQEFSIKKRGKNIGYADLWIRSSNQESGEYIEVKQEWSLTKANDGLAQAVKDAKKLLVDKESMRIGLLFISPAIHEKFESEIDKKIKEAIVSIKQIKCDAIAWSFPAISRTLRGGGRAKHYFYPGVILLAKVADQ